MTPANEKLIEQLREYSVTGAKRDELLIRKMDLFSKDLAEYSLETVKQFYEDAQGLSL